MALQWRSAKSTGNERSATITSIFSPSSKNTDANVPSMAAAVASAPRPKQALLGHAMVTVGFLITIIYLTMLLVQRQEHSEEKSILQLPTWLSGMAVTAYHVEYLLSFMFVKLVAPITYGACYAVRRLSIIISGRQMFGGAPFSRLDKAGIGWSWLGLSVTR